MAVRLLTKLRSLQTTVNHRHFLSSHLWRKTLPPQFASPISSPTCNSRRFSDAVQPFSRETSISKETLASLNQSKISGGNGAAAAAPASIRSSLDDAEVAKFSAVAETWWDSDGPFKPLHALNPTRLAFIRSTLCHHFRKDPESARPFEGLKFVDVGCGGGILSENWSQLKTATKDERNRALLVYLHFIPLARMGATVTGVDAVDKNIKIASLHAELDPMTSSIEYLCTTAEKLVEEKRQFDAVIALEVIEHVADPTDFCKSLAALTVTNGATVISTVNRTMRGYAATIVIAEYILHWLPKGTHEWSKFVTPEELALILQRASVTVQEMAGFVYNPLSGKWALYDDISVNYIAYGTKNAE